MATIITANDGTADTSTPDVLEGFEARRDSRNIFYDLITGTNTAVVIREAGLRSGQLKLWYSTAADAFAALELHGRATTFDLANDVTEAEMTYAADGTMAVAKSRTNAWVLTVGYREVQP